MAFKFLSLFNDLLIPNHRSLNFRALIFAAMLVAKKNVTSSDYAAITQIASQIYGSDMRRCNALLHSVKDYVEKIQKKQGTLDRMLGLIDSELISVPRYAKKIDFSHLRQLMIESDEEDAITQTQVYDFILSEVRRVEKKEQAKASKKEKNA
ncbi:MAG: hypothetical protein SPH77_03230 [Campylobacter sp.]|uniref:hypothetical protein n=1 Tax=Campylobacter sp. TaxID=205 RepID=UPI002A827848|nr:hypothetical protein [Campylobacter sp.]MCI6177562.1 hypothetical protein [Campylobacter sp.]MCI7362448.1 hypothetical protein [Campylobacter sp.]MCI7501510.1 hypothetical protein [Campylobacter sp.]MCI7587005.1 hypothetical protein [Campylobacter sp.]MDY4803091.1 hypothetical protein [Campylobacter sp.]